jgi:hypothetical protein
MYVRQHNAHVHSHPPILPTHTLCQLLACLFIICAWHSVVFCLNSGCVLSVRENLNFSATAYLLAVTATDVNLLIVTAQDLSASS